MCDHYYENPTPERLKEIIEEENNVKACELKLKELRALPACNFTVYDLMMLMRDNYQITRCSRTTKEVTRLYNKITNVNY